MVEFDVRDAVSFDIFGGGPPPGRFLTTPRGEVQPPAGKKAAGWASQGWGTPP